MKYDKEELLKEYDENDLSIEHLRCRISAIKSRQREIERRVNK